MIRLVPTAMTDPARWLIGIGAFVASVVGLLFSITLLSPFVVLAVAALAMLVARSGSACPPGCPRPCVPGGRGEHGAAACSASGPSSRSS